MSEYLEVLSRIAVALEYGNAQTDESVARHEKWRRENIERHERELKEQLDEARVVNARLLKQIEEALGINARNLAIQQEILAGTFGR